MTALRDSGTISISIRTPERKLLCGCRDRHEHRYAVFSRLLAYQYVSFGSHKMNLLLVVSKVAGSERFPFLAPLILLIYKQRWSGFFRQPGAGYICLAALVHTASFNFGMVFK